MDFPLYELLDQHRMFEPSLLDGFDNLKVRGFYFSINHKLFSNYISYLGIFVTI